MLFEYLMIVLYVNMREVFFARVRSVISQFECCCKPVMFIIALNMLIKSAEMVTLSMYVHLASIISLYDSEHVYISLARPYFISSSLPLFLITSRLYLCT